MRRKGFTLIEIIVVMIIIAALAAIAIPNYTHLQAEAAANNAEHNLIAIYNAQKTFYFNNNAICGTGGAAASSTCQTALGDANCADTLLAINCNLGLNLQDNVFSTYTCTSPSAGQFTCTANDAGNTGAIQLTVTNSPIIMPSGTCTPSAGLSGCNPNCNYGVYSSPQSSCPNS